MAPANLQTEWCRLLFRALRGAGVRDVVVSPGSRSTPLVLAAAETPGLVLHDVVDERAAAFFALGQARVSGAPSVLLCTSGSAAGHYLPAAIEAGAAGVPLVLLTADRPFELQGCGAPQTIDQVKLFGDHVRGYFELGQPDAAPAALRAVKRVAAQAVLASTWPVPGAVHINARARKPLEPQPARTTEEQELAALVREIGEVPVQVYPGRLAPDQGGVAALAARCAAARCGLIVCGPAPVSQAEQREAIFGLARATGFPLLVESASQLRFVAGAPAPVTDREARSAAVTDREARSAAVTDREARSAAVIDREARSAAVIDAFDVILRAPAAALARLLPDLIIQIGAAPTSGAWEAFVQAHGEIPRAVLAPQGWPDPHGTAELLLLGDVGDAARAVAARLSPPAEGWWQRVWQAANERAWRVVRAALAADTGPGEGEAVRATIAGAPPGSLLVLGNSLPIREVDALCPAGLAQALVVSQRGASGIDGLIAGAAGAASVFDGPVTLLLGDVSALHDLSGLALCGAAPGSRSAAGAAVQRSLAVVVIHNGGGRIFEMLPLGSSTGMDAAALAHFTTPHQVDFSHAALLYGHRFARAPDAAALAQELLRAHAQPGCTVIEATVAPHSAVALLRGLAAPMAEMIAATLADLPEEGP